MNRLLAITAGIGLATVAGAQGKAVSSSTLLQATSADSRGDINHTPALNQSSSRAATTVVLDISGEQSWDAVYDSSNTILYVPIPTGKQMTGIGWDVTLATVGGSWLSEARFYFDGSDRDGTGLWLTPGAGNSAPGTGTFTSPVIDLAGAGIPPIPILADGLLWIELNESFDDVADAVDADWLATSTLTIVYDDAPPPPPPVCNLYEDFDSGTWPPAGWTVVDNTTGGQVWQIESYFGYGNSTGGTGESASINADWYGSAGTRDSELWTAPITLTNAVTLAYDMDYQNFAFIDFADVDISTDGGTTWANLVSYNSDLTGTYSVDLAPYVGSTAIIRFHYYDFGNWGWWWQVDDLRFPTSATAAFRNAGSNPATLTLSGPPVRGTTIQAFMDVGSTGHAFGQLFGYAGMLSFTLPGGQVVLTDFTNILGELLTLPILGGPVVTYDLPIPTFCVLQGLGVTMQGAQFGGGTPWVLTNAQDVVVGD